MTIHLYKLVDLRLFCLVILNKTKQFTQNSKKLSKEINRPKREPELKVIYLSIARRLISLKRGNELHQ